MKQLELIELKSKLIGPVSLSVNTAECITIMGDSGSGKTMLLRMIADIDPHNGSLILDDTDRAELAAPIWRKRVALLPSKPGWWEDSVGDHFNSFDTVQFEMLGFTAEVLKWSISRISTGELQRLALLRLMENKPDVILLDEPTSSLDPNNKRQVEQLISDYIKKTNAAVIWVTHDLEQAKRVSTKRYKMDSGKLQETLIQ